MTDIVQMFWDILKAAGHDDCENMDLYLNGSKLADLYAPSTGSWTSWASITQEVSLVKGLNTVEFRADESSADCMNIDYLGLERVDVRDSLLGQYMLVSESTLSLGWNPGSGYTCVYRTSSLTNEFSLIEDSAFEGTFSDAIETNDAARFYKIAEE